MSDLIPAKNKTSALARLEQKTEAMVVKLQESPTGYFTNLTQALGEATVVVARETLFDVCSYLKVTPGLEFNMLADLCGADRGEEEEPRLEINYHLFSTIHHHRLRLKVLVDEYDSTVPSVTGIWKTANWHERETYDLFGVVFEGHPDLRRILMPEDSVGYPLRKDYPLRGYEPYSFK